MAKPSAPATDHKGSLSPQPTKLYTYGELEFGLLQGGQPERNFNINWMRATPSNDGTDRGPEPTGDASGRSRRS